MNVDQSRRLNLESKGRSSARTSVRILRGRVDPSQTYPGYVSWIRQCCGRCVNDVHMYQVARVNQSNPPFKSAHTWNAAGRYLI